MRAALLPTPGDPYITAAWLNHYKKVWKDEVDKLYIHFNSRLEDPIITYSFQLAEQAGADYSYDRQWKGHGEALRVIFDRSPEDHIVFVEDDAYVRFPGIMDDCFKRVEDGRVDAVTNPRGSVGMDVMAQEQRVFGLKGDEFHKPNFWPCFFFAHRNIFDNTDKDFACKNWYPGDVIPQLNNYEVASNQSGDTFSWMSIQLRAEGKKFFQIEDGRSTTQDYWLYDMKSGIFANPPVAPWIHFGSTSSGISNSLLDDDFKPLENRAGSPPTALPTMPDDHIRDDYARRISLWYLCWKHFQIPESHPAAYFNKVYGDALERLIDGCQIDRDRIMRYNQIYMDALGFVFND